MAKICKKCDASVNSKSMECPYCGSTKFENEFIEPIENHVQHLPKSDQDDGVYSDKLEQLINLALSDGELTEKEKQVLFKKAEQEGIDLDEFEMVLDSKLKLLQLNNPSSNNSYSQHNTPPPPPVSYSNQAPVANIDSYTQLERLIDLGLKDGEINELERQTIFEKGISLGISNNEINMILSSKIDEKNKLMAQSAAPKSDKFGDVKKCPACGAIAQSFQTKCSDCGHEFSNIEANASIDKLFKMLNDAEDMRKEDSDTSNPLKALGGFYANSLSGMTGPGKVDKKKMEIISNFPVPTTKDDILEFLSLAVPKAKQIGNFLTKHNPENKAHNEFVPVWKTKCEQIIMKAKFSMKEDNKALEEIMQYANELGIK